MKAHVKSLVLPMFLMLALTLLVTAGCAKKPATTTTATGDAMTTEQMGQDASGLGETGVTESGIDGEGMGGVATAAVSGLNRVHFDFDQYNLTAEAQQTLVANAAYMKDNADVKVRIEGYCDERGSDEYNLALGQRRAIAAKNYMVSLGVATDRLSVISYGEELPLDASGTEAAYALNRRAEFKAEL